MIQVLVHIKLLAAFLLMLHYRFESQVGPRSLKLRG